MSTGGIRAFSFTPDDGVPPGVAPFAHATAAGQTLYVTGQMPTDVSERANGKQGKVLRNTGRHQWIC